MKTIGEKIKAKRIEKRMTQQELADKIGVSYTTVSLYESDSRKPSFKALARIAEVFEVTQAYFFEENANDDSSDEKIQLAARKMKDLSEADFEMVNNIIKSLSDRHKEGK